MTTFSNLPNISALAGTELIPLDQVTSNANGVISYATRYATLAQIILAANASPPLSGTPTAPTPAAGDNSTRVATTAYADRAVAALNNGAPPSLDTFAEVASALGNDPNFATTMATALGNRLRLDAAGGYTAMQQSQALANLGLNATGVAAANALDNAEFRIAQRGTTFSNVSSGKSLPDMTLDRWYGFRAGYVAGLQVSQVGSINGYPAAMRLQRAQGDTSTAYFEAGQIIETGECARLAGQTVTLSVWIRAGANFSASPSTVQLAIRYGAGSDEGRAKMASATWAGQGVVSGTVSVTTSAQRLSVTLAIPATATELAVAVLWSPTGTAGAADFIDVSGIQLEPGTGAGPVQRRSMAEDLQRCARHFVILPASARGWASTAGATYAEASIVYPIAMRVSPSSSLSITGSRSGNLASAGMSGGGNAGARFEITTAGTGDFYALTDLWAFGADL